MNGNAPTVDIGIFVTFDAKMEVYGVPFFAPSSAYAVRMFTDQVNDGDGLMSRHPEDFTLFDLGTFNTESGVITAVAPKALCNGVQVKESSDNG